MLRNTRAAWSFSRRTRPSGRLRRWRECLGSPLWSLATGLVGDLANSSFTTLVSCLLCSECQLALRCNCTVRCCVGALVREQPLLAMQAAAVAGE